MGQVVLSKNDAWVFMAIGDRPFGWDGLAGVVSSLDYLNRTMPTESEFEASVTRLGVAGLIAVSPKGFRKTRAGRSVMKRFGLGVGVIVVMLDLMNEWDGLAVAEADGAFKYQLKPGEWQEAQDEYGVRVTKWIAKHTR